MTRLTSGKRSWFCLKSIAFPAAFRIPAKPELAGRRDRQAQNLLEMRFVAMPADSHANTVFGEEQLPDGCSWQAGPGLNPCSQRRDPVREVFSLFEFLLTVIVMPPTEATRRLPPNAPNWKEKPIRTRRNFGK